MSNLRIILIMVALIAVSPSCNSQKAAVQKTEVISLKENYKFFEEIALEWDEKAYLESAEIPISSNSSDNSSWIITAHFLSPKKPSSTLVVELLSDGRITHFSVRSKIDLNQRSPIKLTDWMIDSAEALVLFQNSDIGDELKILDGLNSLFLERVLSEPGEPVVWRLTTDMGSRNGQHYYMDPITGNILNISR